MWKFVGLLLASMNQWHIYCKVCNLQRTYVEKLRIFQVDMKNCIFSFEWIFLNFVIKFIIALIFNVIFKRHSASWKSSVFGVGVLWIRFPVDSNKTALKGYQILWWIIQCQIKDCCICALIKNKTISFMSVKLYLRMHVLYYSHTWISTFALISWYYLDRYIHFDWKTLGKYLKSKYNMHVQCIHAYNATSYSRGHWRCIDAVYACIDTHSETITSWVVNDQMIVSLRCAINANSSVNHS